jgi:hypothetical protein
MMAAGRSFGEDARARMASEGLLASPWSNVPGDRYGAHRHDYDKVLVAASGSITFDLPELQEHIDLQAGDRLDLPASTLHGALVGADGVTCLEAHVVAGSLGARPRHAPGWAATAASTKPPASLERNL